MNYKDKRVAITGWSGFLGTALTVALQGAGAIIDRLYGDVRDPKTFQFINHEYDYLFHFGAPSSQVQFARDAWYCYETTIKGFVNAAKVCRENGVKLIYPSTGLLSQEKENEYARCKKVLEDLHKADNLDALCVRIFATYGPGEGHKRDYASVPYLFARDMVAGRSPIVFGDGEQTRDFIYIDDVINSIMILAEECNDPIVDVGAGRPTSFNEIIRTINLEVDIAEEDIPETVYVDKPNNYVHSTLANNRILLKYYTPKVTFTEGIAKVVKELQDV